MLIYLNNAWTEQRQRRRGNLRFWMLSAKGPCTHPPQSHDRSSDRRRLDANPLEQAVPAAKSMSRIAVPMVGGMLTAPLLTIVQPCELTGSSGAADSLYTITPKQE
jgi:hypothetical protein